MTFDFFEGAAGTGKTHNLVERAREIVQGGALAEGQKLLALTFMNGARHRLEARLSEISEFRRRFLCQTFDAFALTLSSRRRSLITPEIKKQADGLNEFDGPCALAAALLEQEIVRQWVARSFPLILVDEAQDLDEHRLRILQGLSSSCRIVAAADAFQCLDGYLDTGPLIDWLERAGQTHPLTQVHRTDQQGLLAAAHAVREGRVIISCLTQSRRARRRTWYAQGFRLLESFATNSGIVARTIADEVSYRTGPVTILSPDMKSQLIRQALDLVSTRVWPRNGQNFGPFPLKREKGHDIEANDLLAEIELPVTADYVELCELLVPLAEENAVIAQTIRRMDRLRRVCGQTTFDAAQVSEFIKEAVRNRSRLGMRQLSGHLAMTIHHAKNREFRNVIVLWPHTVPRNPELQRRLLYNAITRAKNHCTVIVLGQGRINQPPFAPATS